MGKDRGVRAEALEEDSAWSLATPGSRKLRGSSLVVLVILLPRG